MSTSPGFKFAGLNQFKRNPDIEGKTGSIFEIAGDRWIKMLAATDNNPKWVARRKIINEGIRRLANADASDRRYREFIVPHWVDCCFLDWGGGWMVEDGSGGEVEIPYSPEAAKAVLLDFDDIYEQVVAIIGDHKKFRDERVRVVVDKLGN